MLTFAVARMHSVAASVWSGPGDLNRPLRLEWRLVLGRWLAMLFVAAGLRLYELSSTQLIAAYGVLLGAFLYSLLLVQLIRRRHPAATAGVVPTVGDAALCALMLPIVGGFDSPFYAVLYLVVLSVGIRFGLACGLLVAAAIGLIDWMTMHATGDDLGAAYTLRTGVVFATVLITNYLHDEARKTESALADRLTQAESLNAALQHQALHDSLTGLPNRVFLRQQLDRATLELQAGATAGGLLLLDLNHFKEVNDSLGHPAGDRLLTEVATRLSGQVSTTDMVARLGGDEFAVLLPNLSRGEVLRAASRLSHAVGELAAVDGHSLHLRASIGVVLFPEHGTDADLLLQRADVAMYSAKRGGLEYAVYDATRDDSATRLALAGELQQAILRNQLVLHYQPKLDLRTNRMVGVEALVRWQHPERGLVPPDQFVPLAEQTGLIDLLSRHVIRLALEQIRDWSAAGLHLPIAINLSARDLIDPGLPAWIEKQLRMYAVDPRDIEVEVTETMLIGDPDQAAQSLADLRRMGVQSAIDDFGTGYSSLGYLKRLPVTTVKIDRCFVQGMANDDGDLAIVAAAIDLSHRLGLHVLAEGVEDQQTISLLRDLGCDQAQGYVIGRPQTAMNVAALVRQSSYSEPVELDIAA